MPSVIRGESASEAAAAGRPAPPAGFRAGFVAIVGRPNVGKSTLMNRLLGQKLSITSPKPQTTRNRIVGVKHRPDAQLVLLDTPGIHRAGSLFNQELVRAALRGLAEADLVLWLVDGTDPATPDDQVILEQVRSGAKAVVLAINKIDLIPKPSLLPVMAELSQLLPNAEIVPISATAGDNLDRLEDLLARALPEGPALFEPDQVTDLPERFFIAELLREQVLRLTHEEVPYAVAVQVEAVRPRAGQDLTDVEATIYVEKPSQKAIVIGQGGQMLKAIGSRARPEIEELLGTRVYLQLWVKVLVAWRREPGTLRRLGYLAAG
jgi:GTP-binding protein Era